MGERRVAWTVVGLGFANSKRARAGRSGRSKSRFPRSFGPGGTVIGQPRWAMSHVIVFFLLDVPRVTYLDIRNVLREYIL